MGILKKKAVVADEPNLSPGEMVSREAARVEQEIMIDLLETAVRNHLYAPFQIDSIWYEPDFRTYRVKLRVAGKDEKGKTISLVFTGSITEEAIAQNTGDTSAWRMHLDIVVRAWITTMSRQLNQKGATRLLVGGRRKNYVELSASVDDLTRKIDKFQEATRQISKSFDAFKGASAGITSADMPWRPNQQPLSPAERKSLMESLRQSAERRTS